MSYCRLCLMIFENLENVNIQIIQVKIKAVFSFEITPYPGLPEVICSSCVAIVSQFYDYFCLVHQNQLKLYCRMEDNLLQSEASTSGDNQTKEGILNVKTEIQDDILQSHLDEHNEPDPMEVDSLLTERNGRKDDELKIESTVPNLNDSYGLSDKIARNQIWMFENNMIFRPLDMACDICHEDQFTYQNLDEHIKNGHSMHCNITCCKQKLSGEQILSNHFKKHVPVVKIEIPTANNHIHEIEDEIKIEPIEVHLHDSTDKVGITANVSPDRSWKFINNKIGRQLNMSCDICHEDQLTYRNLEMHLNSYHARRCYISCCGQKLSNGQVISQHFEQHQPVVRSKKPVTDHCKQRKFDIFASVFTDFKNDLDGYEPLPDIKLALQDHFKEKKKLFSMVDHLVQKYFALDCELCDKKIERVCERRKHFKQNHRETKYFVSCCGCRFKDGCNMMQHLNHHWKRVIMGVPYVVTSKQARSSHSKRLALIMEKFRDELVEGGFNPPINLMNTKNLPLDQLSYLHKMQDYLIAKHFPLNCEICNAKITTYPERREHFRVNHSDTQHFVLCCGTKFFVKIRIFVHLQDHKFKRRSSYIRGISQEEQDRGYSTIENYFKMDCMFCGYKGTSYLMLRSHVQKNHKEEGFYITCCGKRIEKRCDILAHIVTHQNPSFKCNLCEEKFSNRQNLKSHTISKHPEDTREIFKCDQCDEYFFNKNLLYHHTYGHRLGNCEICGKQMNLVSLRRHITTVHPGQKTLQMQREGEVSCSLCSKICKTNKGLRLHQAQKHPKVAVNEKDTAPQIKSDAD